ncbi:MAG: hypothetical protein JO144_08590 [Actinobacteria bacterium]|nr:hypothetical protein [Actinomycetota bacterium]
MPIKLKKRKRCEPHCTGPWKPVGKRDRYGRGNQFFPMKECRVCGYQS